MIFLLTWIIVAANMLSRRSLVTIGVCTGLLVIYAVVAYSAALTKSPTFDEPLHLVGGYVHKTAHDFRINPEDPPLFGFIASILQPSGSLKLNYNWDRWPALLEDFNKNQWEFVMITLFQTPDNPGDSDIQSARFVFVLIGVILGATIAWWSWRLAGAAAAIIATTIYAFDPNFMAHGALVKNDVPLALIFLLLMIALWRFGQHATWPSLIGIALACAAAVTVKFSGLLVGPVVFLALIVRAMLPRDWSIGRRWTLTRRWQRLVVVPVVCVMVATVCFVSIWGCYGFRFSPTPDPNARLDTESLALRTKDSYLTYHGIDTKKVLKTDISRQKQPLVDSIKWAESARLLPQAWLHGLLYTYNTTLNRNGYLLGEVSAYGWWYYFPTAMLFKTPVPTLLAFGLAFLAGVTWLILRRRMKAAQTSQIDWWTVLCLALPVIVYGYSAMTTTMNVGIRHVLPIYPFLFIGCGIALAAVVNRWKLAGNILLGVLALGLAVGVLWTYPNYLAYFNLPSDALYAQNGYPGAFRLLGDSNLDWGQDLKELAKFQKKDPFTRMYLVYFGLPDPEYYGVHALHVPGGWYFAPSMHKPDPSESMYFAISATFLQGFFYIGTGLNKEYEPLKYAKPYAVLGGGSIYIYKFPLSNEEKREITNRRMGIK